MKLDQLCLLLQDPEHPAVHLHRWAQLLFFFFSLRNIKVWKKKIKKAWLTSF